MPVLADAGTAVAARAGRAVRAVAWDVSRGMGIVGSPARAARPGTDASVCGRRCAEPGMSSIVRMAAALRRRDDGGAGLSTTPPGAIRPPAGGGGHRNQMTAYDPAGGVDLTSNLCGASHVLVWRNSPRMGLRIRGLLTESCAVAPWTMTGRGNAVTQGDAAWAASTHRNGSVPFRRNWAVAESRAETPRDDRGSWQERMGLTIE